MAWELVAIWLIVAATVIWFIRDEDRIKQQKLAERARLYATGAAWRHMPRPAVEPMVSRIVAAPGKQSALQTKFLEELRRR